MISASVYPVMMTPLVLKALKPREGIVILNLSPILIGTHPFYFTAQCLLTTKMEFLCFLVKGKWIIFICSGAQVLT
jgi:hypothetical protein